MHITISFSKPHIQHCARIAAIHGFLINIGSNDEGVTITNKAVNA
ncbi:hypothetical protein P245_15370 [Comamonas thiooxydans]|uniref:Uncharacterized protein n=1 Tax=Comamonas thiooxydans TaxID=363952 RepID=A0A0E3BFE9_9BURK|nr:hypothetical protein P245_15370 [Comamonas thiooxydans]